MTTNLSVPKVWNSLAIVSLVLGLLSVLLSFFSSRERLIEIHFLNNNWTALYNGRLWDQVPQVHLSICGGGFIVGIVAFVIGIISLIQIRKVKVAGKGLAIIGIILGEVVVIVTTLLFVLSLLSYAWIYL